MSTSSLRRQMKNIVHNYSEAEIKVREATSNDPWGPSSSLMSEIADLTYNVVAFSEIMSMIWKRLNDHGKNWRHVYKVPPWGPASQHPALTTSPPLPRRLAGQEPQGACGRRSPGCSVLLEGAEWDAAWPRAASLLRSLRRKIEPQGLGDHSGAWPRTPLRPPPVLSGRAGLLQNHWCPVPGRSPCTQPLPTPERPCARAGCGVLVYPALPHPPRGCPGARRGRLRVPSPCPPPRGCIVSFFPAASSASAASAPTEAEQAWPQSSGEEELQLQLALAMSKEEAEQPPVAVAEEDLQLQLALSLSREEHDKVRAAPGRSNTLPTIGVWAGLPPTPTALTPAPTRSALTPLTARHHLAELFSPPGKRSPASDPWSSGPAPAPQGKPAADPWAPAQTFPDPWGGSPSKASTNCTAASGAFEPDEFSDFDSLRPALPKSGSSTGGLGGPPAASPSSPRKRKFGKRTPWFNQEIVDVLKIKMEPYEKWKVGKSTKDEYEQITHT
nr:epsin-1 [Pelodiscus sinensis]|eukprot:XP_025034919.1 epsin-1 [Pelodiscus sinensis]